MEQRPKTILIADDDPAILDMLTLFLEEMGYLVETTSDEYTLRTIAKNLPDLLLLDIWMSGMDGRDICRFLKGQEATCHIPIILVSANREIEQIARVAGADDFLAKPFNLGVLMAKIEHWLEEESV